MCIHSVCVCVCLREKEQVCVGYLAELHSAEPPEQNVQTVYVNELLIAGGSIFIFYTYAYMQKARTQAREEPPLITRQYTLYHI